MGQADDDDFGFIDRETVVYEERSGFLGIVCDHADDGAIDRVHHHETPDTYVETSRPTNNGMIIEGKTTASRIGNSGRVSGIVKLQSGDSFVNACSLARFLIRPAKQLT